MGLAIRKAFISCFTSHLLMNTTRVQHFILYTLGKWFEEANRKIDDRLMRVSISKPVFIELVKSAGFTQKQERALYKNLEILEEKKLVEYKNKELVLTKKGNALYADINKRIAPFFNVSRKLRETDPISYSRKVQTVFR